MTAVKLLYRVSEAADALGVSTQQVYTLAAAGDLAKVYIGKGTRNFRITADSLRDYVAQLKTEPREP